MEAVIDLGEPKAIHRVGVDCLRAQAPWIFLPRRVEIGVSMDGESWIDAGWIEIPLVRSPETEAVRLWIDRRGGDGPTEVRFLRVLARNRGRLPEWHPGYPEDAWVFADEIVVE